MSNCSPLIAASDNGHTEVVEYLLEQAMFQGVEIKREEKSNAVRVAVLNNHIEIVRLLVGSDPGIVTARYNDGEPILTCAVRFNYFTMMQFLARSSFHGDNIDATDGDGCTALHSAAALNRLDMVSYLVQHSAAVNKHSHANRTPLHMAACKGNLEVVKYLVQKKAKVNLADEDGNTPCSDAVSGGHLEVLTYLIEHGADKDGTDYGISPLCLASSNGNLDIARYLVQQGANNVKAITRDGPGALFLAARNGHLEVVQYLVTEALVDVNITTRSGWTPLHVAANLGHISIMRCLMEYSAQMDLKTDDGQLAVDVSLDDDVREVFNFEEKRRRDHGFKRAVLVEPQQQQQQKRTRLSACRARTGAGAKAGTGAAEAIGGTETASSSSSSSSSSTAIAATAAEVLGNDNMITVVGEGDQSVEEEDVDTSSVESSEDDEDD